METVVICNIIFLCAVLAGFTAGFAIEMYKEKKNKNDD